MRTARASGRLAKNRESIFDFEQIPNVGPRLSGEGIRQPVESMPGVDQTSVDEMLSDARDAAEVGVGGVILFGIPDKKDATGSEAWNDDAPVQRAIRALKRDVPQLVVITDVC